MTEQNVIPFDFEGQNVRVIERADGPWFVAADVSDVLGYRMASDMTRGLDDDEKGTHILRTLGGDQSLAIINESGLYSSILSSRRPEAKRFKRWVTGEVLPTIRRTGSYNARPGTFPVTMDDLKVLVREIVEAERLANPQHVALGFLSALDVAKRHKIAPKGRRGIVLRISARLRKYCLQNGFAMRFSAESNKYLFEAGAVDSWLLNGGFDVIRECLSRLEGQGVFKLVPKKGGAS